MRAALERAAPRWNDCRSRAVVSIRAARGQALPFRLLEESCHHRQGLRVKRRVCEWRAMVRARPRVVAQRFLSPSVFAPPLGARSQLAGAVLRAMALVRWETVNWDEQDPKVVVLDMKAGRMCQWRDSIS